MADVMTVLTANCGFSTTPSSLKLTLGDCDNDRQPEIAIFTFCSPILQFLAVGRCRNHSANRLSSSMLSKIPNLALKFKRYLSEFQIVTFGFGGHIEYFRLSVAVVLTYQHYFTPIHALIPQICRWNFNCAFHSFGDITTSGQLAACHLRFLAHTDVTRNRKYDY